MPKASPKPARTYLHVELTPRMVRALASLCEVEIDGVLGSEWLRANPHERLTLIGALERLDYALADNNHARVKRGEAEQSYRIERAAKRKGGTVTIHANCTEACTATPECATCGKPKKLRGRDYPMGMGNSYCDWECDGYNQEPISGHLWWSEWREHVASKGGS